MKKIILKSKKDLPLYFHGRVNRDELHKVLLTYDLTIIPLLNRIYGSVPSKIFEYAKLGLPMLYFGGGEGEDLIKKNSLGWVANEGNYDDLNTVLKSISAQHLNLELKTAIQDTASIQFDFKKQLTALKAVI